VAHTADVGSVRRAVSGHAERLRAGPELAFRAGQAATELAANLLRHAHPGGWILARPVPPAAMELLAVDRGPGISDVAAAVGGWSPRHGGLGCGLSAVAGVSSYFDIVTGPGQGTTVLAIVASGKADRAAASRAARPPRCWAGVSVGLDEACGDGWAVADVSGGTTVAVIDGLGHGAYASTATDAAVAVLAGDPTDLDGYLSRANTAMRGTRGAAVMICRLDPGRGELRCLSVGNVSGRILHGGGQQALYSYRGAVGTQEKPPRARVTSYPWLPGAILVVWTDGLASHIDLAGYAVPLSHDPAVAAAALHRDHSNGHDDSTVVVVRNHATP